ncbi:SMI1/KNR4 family protein [Eisenbergiella massiliensis]|uniref:SMI1/KNR4 family protein n=1 Tax=Eisenbergiella massiliensis TaxID=1720294 RepID=A0A3E3I5Q9_9FIRM|nr:SMI1/KNR4 family protein [Eisenbergiella massiliensis]RGE60969.1 SMI1/KNR4 family protein [Eisenbergiella massiliensis]
MDKCGNFVFNEPYIGNEIKQINNVVLPKQYLEFMKKHNGGQGDIGETWLEFFTLEDLQEINDDYCIEDFLPDHIIIGSNGNGELYGIDSDGVYFNVPAIMDEDDVTVLGDDINLLPDKINNFWK